MGMNSQLHLVLSSDLLEKLRKESDNRDLTISDLCREKLREDSQLDKIEFMLKKLLESE